MADCAGFSKSPTEYGRQVQFYTMEVLGNGSVVQRDKSKPRGRCRKWELSVRVVENGVKRTVTRPFRGTYTNAVKAKGEFVAELAGSSDAITGDIPFSDYADAWMDRLRESNAYARRTLVGYESKLKTAKMHLTCNVGEVTREMVESMYARCLDGETLSGRPWSASSCANLNRVLSSLFHDAMDDDGICASCPTRGVKLPKTVPRKVIVPTERDVDRLLKKKLDYSDPVQRAVALCCACGIRRSEAAYVRWDDIRRGLLYVWGSVEDDATDTTTKNEEPKIVPIPAFVLKKLKRHMPKDRDTRICGGIRPDSITQWWDRNRKRLGLECRLHDMRHAYATRLVEHGAGQRAIMDLGGWKSSVIPTMIYTHTTESMKRELVDAAFGGKKKKKKRKVADSGGDSVRVSCGNYSDTEINVDYSISDNLRFSGGPLGVRTLDLGIKSPLLCQLS